MAKRTLDAFFKPTPSTTAKRAKPDPATTPPTEDTGLPDTHTSYPIAIPQLPSHISVSLTHGTPAKQPRRITNQPDLDLLYFQPYIARATANELFKFLRRELPFYRVQYNIKRGGVETQINTPRYTTVFGVDETARFIPACSVKGADQDHDQAQDQDQDQDQDQNTSPYSEATFPDAAQDANSPVLVDAQSHAPVRSTKYQYPPRPIPTCLSHLQSRVEAVTGAKYNFCLVNYYASGNDSIAFHSDDERFLGGAPNIASLSLGGEREFIMKHKPESEGSQAGTRMGGGDCGGIATLPLSLSGRHTSTTTPLHLQSGHANSTPVLPQAQQLKIPLCSGDMVVMRGPTQSHWQHSIPKRKGRAGDAVRGRINITFRRAVIPAGTNNYYHYNVGCGPVWRWNEQRGEIVQTEKGELENIE
ncbi:uncharacterized protein N7482_009128 [Penicillium canariense]|uniref:Fe2OG dioxygenase domain-containing protein n=1 Tax=Penicillium canariense TaxID=189055 RepID=A0A9W9HQ55_9EURO|nr:uncharacterized protein N7482_009128 [Penicillium canariense]KAJ5152650.1 hypothetical protein N7482_009128 [Penicillium canariense]